MTTQVIGSKGDLANILPNIHSIKQTSADLLLYLEISVLFNPPQRNFFSQYMEVSTNNPQLIKVQRIRD